MNILFIAKITQITISPNIEKVLLPSLMTEVAKYKLKSDYGRLSLYSTYTPSRVGSFVINSVGDLSHSNSAQPPRLREYTLPLDLNEGYDPGRDYDKEYFSSKSATNLPGIDKGLKWLLESRNKDVLSNVNVITQRGVLRDIGNTLHDYYKSPWKLEVCKYMGKLYIRKEESREDVMTPFQALHSYMGKRFEEYVLHPHEDEQRIYNVLTGTIGRYRNILLTAEVDGINDKGQQVELKTCFPWKLKQKIPAAWLQSYLGGIDLLYYGLKEKTGWVNSKHKELDVRKLPGKFSFPETHANSMFGFISDVLEWLDDNVKEANTVWLFEYTGKRNPQSIRLVKEEGKFLPDWYKIQISSLVEEVDSLTLEHPVTDS